MAPRQPGQLRCSSQARGPGFGWRRVGCPPRKGLRRHLVCCGASGDKGRSRASDWCRRRPPRGGERWRHPRRRRSSATSMRRTRTLARRWRSNRSAFREAWRTRRGWHPLRGPRRSARISARSARHGPHGFRVPAGRRWCCCGYGCCGCAGERGTSGAQGSGSSPSNGLGGTSSPAHCKWAGCNRAEGSGFHHPHPARRGFVGWRRRR